jgi:hypothetical protein
VSIVDKRWRGLHLQRQIRRLLKRTHDFQQGAAARHRHILVAANHLKRIFALSRSDRGNSKLARRFAQVHADLCSGKKKLFNVDWEEYEPLLVKRGTPLLELESKITANLRTRCCVKYLELLRATTVWDSVIEPIRPVIEWVKALDVWDKRIATERDERRRRLAASRQRRKRYPLPRDTFRADAP